MRAKVVPALAVGLLLLSGGAAGEGEEVAWCGVLHSDSGPGPTTVWSPQSLEATGFEDEIDLSGRTAVIDILFLYTEGAERYWAEEPLEWDAEQRARYGASLRDFVKRQVDTASAALLDSGVNARLRLVGVRRGPADLDRIEGESFDPEHRSYGQGMSWALSWAAGSTEVDAVRDMYGADLVYFVMARDWYVCGLAFFSDSVARIPRASFGALAYDCSRRTVLAHEVGHNLGLIHDRSNAAPGEPMRPMRPGGRGFVGTDAFGKDYLTVMAVGLGLNTAHYSSSSETGDGRVIGLPGEHEAVDALRFAAPYAAAIRRSKQVADGGPYGCRGSGWSDCVGGGRFRVEAEYAATDGQRKPALIREAYLGDSGTLFYFYSWDNPELLVKVLDGCAINGHYWVFGSAATDREYVVRIEDVKGGTVQEYGRGPSAPLIAEAAAFPCGAGHASSSSTPLVETVASGSSGKAAGGSGGRFGPGPAAAVGRSDLADGGGFGCYNPWFKDCTVDGRFGITVKYWLPGGEWETEREKWKAKNSVFVRPAPLGDNSSLFYFFSWNNPELLVKVIDGCAINGHYWVFGSAASDLEYRVEIWDYADRKPDWEGELTILFGRKYWRDASNPLIADTTAFRCEL